MPESADRKHVTLTAGQVLPLRNSATLKAEMTKQSVIKSTQDDIVRVIHVIVSANTSKRSATISRFSGRLNYQLFSVASTVSCCFRWRSLTRRVNCA